MQVIVKGRNTRVSKRIKETATEKLQRVERYLDRIQRLEIEFSEEQNPRIADKHIIEVTLTAPAHTLRAHAAGPDQVSAIDLVSDKLERQVKRLRGKAKKRGERAGGPNSSIRGAMPGPLPEASSRSNARNGSKRPIESEDGESGETGSTITRVKRFAVKPMTVEEAVMQMESLGHDFFLFVSAESAQAGVVYRRRDGSFGLIEQE